MGYLFATDFDGTLFSDSRTIGSRDKETLQRLGLSGITRVIATGRNLYSALRVIENDFPIDYLVFSSGAGIMEWKSKTVIKAYSLDRKRILGTVDFLEKENLDFMLHKPIPDNHYFYFRRNTAEAEDFEKRCMVYSGFSMEWDRIAVENMETACQFVVIVSGKRMEEYRINSIYSGPEQIYHFLREKLESQSELNIVRTTSPLDRKTLWLEIFPAGVSKGNALKTIADFTGTDYNHTAAVGNDFNDLDMLRWAGRGYVVENAPDMLRKEFINVGSNNSGGFTEAVDAFLEFLGKK